MVNGVNARRPKTYSLATRGDYTLKLTHESNRSRQARALEKQRHTRTWQATENKPPNTEPTEPHYSKATPTAIGAAETKQHKPTTYLNTT